MLHLHVIYLSLQEYLKTAKVIPIHKKDSEREVSNYKPISLLPNIDKIFELLMPSRFVEFLREENSSITVFEKMSF